MTPPEVCLLIRNMSVDLARTLVEKEGYQFRIGSVDSRPRALTQNIDWDRITVDIMAGVVIEAKLG